jgi:hypothetical protein
MTRLACLGPSRHLVEGLTNPHASDLPAGAHQLIDRLRHDIQQRLDELLAEADKLRRALAALGPRQRSTPEPTTTKPRLPVKRGPNSPAAAQQTPARTRTRAAGTTNGAGASTRTAPGETKAKVLAALSDDHALLRRLATEAARERAVVDRQSDGAGDPTSAGMSSVP